MENKTMARVGLGLLHCGNGTGSTWDVPAHGSTPCFS